MACMSIAYTKLFNSITDSSVWSEPSDIRVLWITMLAMADRNGLIHASVPGLAHRARISLETTQAGLKKFMEPDPFSRSKDFEGRRIEEVDGGWKLLNHEKYRDLRNEESIRESKRRWAREHRSVQRDNACLDANIPSLEEVVAYGNTLSPTVGFNEEIGRKFFVWHTENRKWVNSNMVLIDWKARLARWCSNERTRAAVMPKVNNGANVSPVSNRISIEKTIRILEDQISKHPANPESGFFDEKRTDLQRAALKDLRKKKEALELKLADIVTEGL